VSEYIVLVDRDAGSDRGGSLCRWTSWHSVVLDFHTGIQSTQTELGLERLPIVSG
jgi:hypothetical protein